MKSIFSISIYVILLLFMLTACEKDHDKPSKNVVTVVNNCGTFDIDTTQIGRAGGDTVFYPLSASFDNVLAGTTPRVHEVLNQAKLKYIKYVEDLSIPSFGIGNGVVAKNYNVTFVFINDSMSVRQLHVAGYTYTQHTQYPDLNNNLFRNNHPAFMVSFVLGPSKRTFNVFRNDRINLSEISVYYDGVLAVKDYYYPWSRFTNIFNVGHRVV